MKKSTLTLSSAAGLGQDFDLFVFSNCVMLAGTHSPVFSSSHPRLINLPRFCTVGEKENQCTAVVPCIFANVV